MGVPPEFGNQIGHRWPGAHGQYGGHAAAHCALPVQSLAHQVSDHQVKDRDARHGEQQVSPGQFGVERVGDDRESRGQAYPRIQHLTEFIRADTDITIVVGSGKPEDQDPEQREHQAEHRVLRSCMIAEADLERYHRGN